MKWRWFGSTFPIGLKIERNWLAMKKIWNLPITHLIPFSEVQEKRPAWLITSTPAWEAVKDQLKFSFRQQATVTNAEPAHWDSLVNTLRNSHSECEVVYGIGGGMAADAAKYCANQLELPLVCMPTALSVDAFLTAASGIRRGGCVVYLETKAPETLILDLDIIAAAPSRVRAAGISDVLSIATGSWDWQFAHGKGMNPPGMDFIPWAYDNAQSILRGVLDCAEAAGRGDRQGLMALYDCLALEVQLCNQLGHARPEEGSEHYFAYAVENIVGHGLPHGDLVGPGIMIVAGLQGQDTINLEKALHACHIPLQNIHTDIVEQTLKTLPQYCRQHSLAYGVAHELPDPSTN
jgi:glycerol-1-phosphate dehydrogenase [NAD(P)+]